MSQIKLKHSGGNSSIIAAPSSNPASDVTFRLPNADGSTGQFMKTDGSGNLAFASVAVGGITMADQYRLTTDLSGSSPNDYITSNLERVDTGGQGTLGTGMSESSGMFTFPSTGIYKVDFQFNAYSTSSQRYVGGRIEVTTDNNNYTILSDSSDGIYVPSTSSWGTSQTSTLIDVTDTSNVKVKFRYYGIGSVTFAGDSNRNRTFMTFIRLGDT
tara:strand:- start:267 stop:908 length:642 start_codon:yes stop_codon:yes gene_type:complete